MDPQQRSGQPSVSHGVKEAGGHPEVPPPPGPPDPVDVLQVCKSLNQRKIEDKQINKPDPLTCVDHLLMV